MRQPSRYDLPGGPEVQTEPGARGRVLRNRLGLTRKRDMDRAEYEALLRAQRAALEVVSPQTRFTAERLRQMHRDWLGEIYVWAGQYRTVDVSKAGFAWPPAARVADNVAALEVGLLARCTPCRPAPVSAVARQIAEVHAELLLVHPFREGNGRLARWLADLMAVKEGYLMRYDPLTAFFAEALERRLRAGGAD